MSRGWKTMRVFLSNLGCKLNWAETEALGRSFQDAGHELVGDLREADIHVVNTCTVTAEAARDSRRLARRAAREGARARTVLTGCHVTYRPDDVAAIAGVDLVVDNTDKDRLVSLVEHTFGKVERRPAPASLPARRTRAAVRAQDGCDMRCAFCVIPLARGGSRSRPADDVVAETTTLVAAGFREIVVTGVQISSWREGHRHLPHLVRRLLDETGVQRLRLSSIAPWELGAELLACFDDPRLCRHLHLSLQSGASTVLRRMKRPQDASHYLRTLEEARREVPGIAITTDVIVGFPGENDAEHEESLAFVASAGFARVHVFSFSPREGTKAADLPDQISPSVKKRRAAAMLDVARRSEATFAAAQVGVTVPVLFEEKSGEQWRGLTDTYVRVAVHSASPLEDVIARVHITAAQGGLASGALARRPR